jgi:hypothetical protein
MSAKQIISFAAMILILSSCGNSGDSKPARKMLIPDEKLVAILTDTYLTTGMIDLPQMRETWAQRDSTLNYTDVIKSYGFTYEQFDATVRYYFTDKPKKLSRIYDRVTGNLLELEAVVLSENGPVEAASGENLWTGKASYIFPEEYTRDPVWFDIPAEKPGEYVLQADIMVFEDDKSLNPRVTVYFSYTDSAGVEKQDYWDEVSLLKDGQFQTVELRRTLDTIPDVRLRGWLLNHDNQPGQWRKHARIANISLRFNAAAEAK